MNKNKPGDKFSVVLEKVGNQPLMTVKSLMQATGLGLSDAKRMVDSTPVTVASDLDSKKAIKLKQQLEAIGNVVSVPGMEADVVTEKPVKDVKTPPKKKSTAKKATAKTDLKINPDLANALAKVVGIVGKDGLINGDRVCNLLGDLVPKLEKERRRIKLAYASNAVSVLINENDHDFAVNEAVKRLVDYSDMADNVAKETILAIYEVLK